jgi:hypothetical protein
VVDTCVARACARKGSTNLHANHCRGALEAIRNGGHKAVVYPMIHDEYTRQENMSRFFLRWFENMRSRRQIVTLGSDPAPYQDVRAAMKRLIPNDAHRVVKKDLHLVGAAMATDERILSDDDTVRAHFTRIAAEVLTLGRVHWANPSAPGCLPWLSRGAPDERTLQLGAG